MDSIWSENSNMPHFESLKGTKKTDVLIIGGGMAGILCAYFLQQQGIDYLLAEGGSICGKITKNTTAKITSQHGLIYRQLLKKAGEEKAKQYLDANQKALQMFRTLSEKIDCDFETKPAYVYSLNHRQKLEEEMKALETLGFSAKFYEQTNLPFPVAGAVAFEKQAQFHPLKFVAKIAENLNIYENTFVTELKPHMAKTDCGEILFDRVIFATHFPIDNKHGLYFLKMYQHRSYVIALKGGQQLNGMYVDEAMCGMSFRNYRELLFIGGGDHRTGKNGGNWQELRKFANRYYPKAEEIAYWATQDCMTLDSVPYIGEYSPNMPGCYVATGFNKWGMTSSMAAAMILCDLIMGKENPYAAVFCPSRNMMKPQLLINGYEAITNLFTFSKKRCPHMGCALKWNAAEHSFDCPCHGSRFTKDGTVLDNPANGN